MRREEAGALDYAGAIEAEITVLRHLGYSEAEVARIVGIYCGYPSWQGLSVNQQRRLAVDLKRHAGLALRWYLALAAENQLSRFM